MYLLILFLIFLLIILIYNNSKSNYVENYIPKDYSRSIDIRICEEETDSIDALTPKYDSDIDLNEIKIKYNKEKDIINQPKIVTKNNKEKLIQLTRIKTHIEDPYYHTYNVESMDNFELVKSDYSIINNIKLEDNQAFVPKNHTLIVK